MFIQAYEILETTYLAWIAVLVRAINLYQPGRRPALATITEEDIESLLSVNSDSEPESEPEVVVPYPCSIM